MPMPDLQFQPLESHGLHSLPPGFEYDSEHQISEDANTIAFNTGLRVDARDFRRCVVCGKVLAGGLWAHVIAQTHDQLVRVCFFRFNRIMVNSV